MRAWVVAHRPLGAGLLAAALHLPFVARYDLHFHPDFAMSLPADRELPRGGATLLGRRFLDAGAWPWRRFSAAP